MGVKCRGAIHRIALENFVTYKNVEIFPSENLNLIIGPNGTGKSTFICAIVLGLCGKAKLIGRAKKLGEYVRAGATEAIIEIDLYKNERGELVKITRNFNVDNNSTWSLNRKSVKEKEVQELVASLNIQVDNLCQLLPQDKVQDFAKMNPQELLKSTLLAISGQDAVALLEELIEFIVDHRTNDANIKKMTKRKAEYEQSIAGLEENIQRMEDMEKNKRELQIGEKKKLWLEYEELKNSLDEIIADKTKAEKSLKLQQKKIEPLKTKYQKAERENSTLETNKNQFIAQVSNLKGALLRCLSESESCGEGIDDLINEWEDKVLQYKNRCKDIALAKTTLNKMINDRENLMSTEGDESTINKSIAEMKLCIEKVHKNINEIKNKKFGVQQELDSKIIPQSRELKDRYEKISDAGRKQLELLRHFNGHAYQALVWLRNNRHIFKHDVYEPMLMELKIGPQFTRYVENTISHRDLTAFTFTDADDMNLFLRKVRGEQKWNMVNAILSPPNNKTFAPDVPISRLKEFGFCTYMSNVITGPAPITNFLCKQYNIHKIPIGNDLTYQKSDSIPSNITLFFSKNHRFAIRVSQYTNSKSTSTNEIRPPKLLMNTIDEEALHRIKSEMDQNTLLKEGKLEEINRIDREVAVEDEKLNKLISKRQKLNESYDQMKTIAVRIRVQENKIQTMENAPYFDVEKEKDRHKVRIQAQIRKRCDLLSNINDLSKQAFKASLNEKILDFQLKQSYNSLVDIKKELQEANSTFTNLEGILAVIDDKISLARRNTKSKLMEAKQSTDNKLPHDSDFPYIDEFNSLPVDIESLQKHLTVLQSRINSADTVDERIIANYNNLKKEAAELGESIQALWNQTRSKEQQKRELRSKWLDPLEKQINDINQRFGDMFAQLGCVGEVQLSKGGGDEDYDKYGISIMVKFRDNEELQLLNRHVQSGGERALTTALYLIALQQSSNVPFRCVDEINQGMDPINERKVFQLLLKIIEISNKSSQYFVLTPKLLDNLEYNKYVKVHTIMNGPKIMGYDKWNFKKFISKSDSLKDYNLTQ